MKQNTSTNDLPPVPPALVAHLKELFPLTPPSVGESNNVIFFNSGKQFIIGLLAQWQEWRDEEGILD